MHRRKGLGPRQVELLAYARRAEGVELRGFAQRGWRGWKRLWQDGLLELRDGRLFVTREGRDELQRAEAVRNERLARGSAG